MSKEFLERCPEVIHEAGAKRASGKYQEAVNLVVEATNCSEEELTRLSSEELSDLMRAWRIDVVANTSLAKRSWTGESAVFHLKEAQLVIEDYYNDPHVKDQAPQFKKDNEGHPYDFAVEMLRDKARHCLAAATITGDASFRLAAIDFFEKAVRLYSEDLGTRGLVIMENQIARGDHLGIFYGYEGIVPQSIATGNLDRARWAARTYFGESLKRFKITECIRALKDLARVRKNPLKIAQDMVIGIVRSAETLSAPLNFVRRRTLPKNFNSEELKIT